MATNNRSARDTLARTIWGESRGEPRRGQAAVASIVMNRARNPRWWGGSKNKSLATNVIEVCVRPWQFSAWNPDTASRRQLLAITDKDAAFRAALAIADEALAGNLIDETYNSDHFHTHGAKPLWSRGLKPITIIGGHRFFRLELRSPSTSL